MALTEDHLINAAVQRGLIEVEVLNRLRGEARKLRTGLVSMVTAHYRFPVSALYRAYAEARGIDYIDIAAYGYNFPSDLLKKIPHSLISRKQVLPVLNATGVQMLALSDPDDRATVDSVQRAVGRHLPIVLADPQALRISIEKALLVSDAPVAKLETDLVQMLDDILRESYLNRASDVHFVVEENGLRVRLRVDGRLRDYPVEADAMVAAGLVSRVKVLANLDIAEQREPQDGGFSYKLAPPIDREFNIRVATAPTRLGERVTMRLLGQESQGLTLTDLGMLEDDLKQFRQAIRKPFGMILLTGPTGSGKSTTLFAALQEINHPEINIMTVENPIEYVMDGVSQIQTGAKISFADALRSLLRHDPDVLMVGEIRDAETADVALKAAMTGHLVFSTLHTNTAVGTVARLIDIGCEPFLIGSTMNAVIAQRLVRRLCPHCKVARSANAEERDLLDVKEKDVIIYSPKGCAYCQGSGYRGRLGLFETLWFDEQLSKLVARGCTEDDIVSAAGSRLRAMWDDGKAKVLAGATTIDELQTVAIKRD
ncbi:MAG: GspE/PulE family protein [Methylotenera sp.]|nr:GspE/PulE family protein [Methylotenera sp.]MDO9389878.1 GspE/PulE family protein [Methylotenera sp.]